VSSHRRHALAWLGALVAAVGTGRAAQTDEQPHVKAAPVLAEPTLVGVILTARVSAGEWRGTHLRMTFQWQRCDAAGTHCTVVATHRSRASRDDYAVQPADLGSRLRVLVTGRNGAGSTSATSNLTTPIVSPGRWFARIRRGRLLRFTVFSRAVNRAQPVYVYLPPGYRAGGTPRRYPVLYLLHGFPGGPGSFVGGVPAPATEDVLLAMGAVRPMILVMPRGVPDLRTETAWVNGVTPHASWETFLSRDVVAWADSCFETAPDPSGRGIAGLSDGGYGALDIALHHPGEFGLVESWSGYEQADRSLVSVYGSDRERLAYDSPASFLPRAAPALRRSNVFIWLYTGRDDPYAQQNASFASQLARAGIDHVFEVVPGGHEPSVYRANLPAAMRVASAHLHARSPSSTGKGRAADAASSLAGCGRGTPLSSTP